MYIVHDVTGCTQYLLVTVLKFHCSIRSEGEVGIEEEEEDGDFALSLVCSLPPLLDDLSSASW